MLSLPLALLSLLPLIKAQSTVSLLMPQAGPSQSLVASIVNADATATTYFINCANATTSSSSPLSASASSLGNFPSSSSSAECGFAPSGVTHIQGPSTAVYTYSSDTSTAAVSCQLTGTTRAVCTASSNFASDTRTDMPAMASGTDMPAMSSGTDMLSAYAPESASASAPAMTSGPSFSTLSDGRQVVTLVASDLSGVFLPVVVTAGQQKAMGASGSGSGSGMGSTSTATGSAGTKTTATGGSATGSTATGGTATGSTATGGTATGSAAAQKATGAAGRVSVEGVVGGMGALAVGVVAAML